MQDTDKAFYDSPASTHMQPDSKETPEKLKLGSSGGSDDEPPVGVKAVDSWHMSANKDGRGMHVTFQASINRLSNIGNGQKVLATLGNSIHCCPAVGGLCLRAIFHSFCTTTCKYGSVSCSALKDTGADTGRNCHRMSVISSRIRQTSAASWPFSRECLATSTLARWLQSWDPVDQVAACTICCAYCSCCLA